MSEIDDMGKKLFVGGLSWNTEDATLRAAFEQFGAVADAKVIKDRETNRSRGFGFVTMADDDGAKEAVAQMDGKAIDGRTVKVSEAQERPPRAGGFGGGGERSGGGGYGGGGNRGSFDGNRGGFGGERTGGAGFGGGERPSGPAFGGERTGGFGGGGDRNGGSRGGFGGGGFGGGGGDFGGGGDGGEGRGGRGGRRERDRRDQRDW